MTRKVEVVVSQADRPKLFQSEKQSLAKIFMNQQIQIEHIGSTAITGIKAKPVIDILVVVVDLQLVESQVPAMEEMGYQALGENGIAGRYFFQKGGEQRTHHVHIFQAGNPEIQRHLAFRDYLNEHRAEAQTYSQLKADLAAKHPTDISSYIAGKKAFIQEIDKKAAA